MANFIQVHFLTSYPPSNLNRDDLGRPKTAYMGGANRLRISSQSLKRAWRKSDLFESALAGHVGVRTKLQGVKIYQKFIEKGIPEKQALEWAKTIAKQFGKEKKAVKDKPLVELEIEQLSHFSPIELAEIDKIIDECVASNTKPDEDVLKRLREKSQAADIACFGRMLASSPEFNVEAAIQVAHAITTHAVDIEDDFFTAVDDLNMGLEDAGAGHLGETEFAAGLFYGYVCIDRDLLYKNLGDDEALTQKTIAALLECIAKISPTGKQNSFASRAYTSYMLVEKGNYQPRSLSVAFLKPVKEKALLDQSITDFETHRNNIDKIYGACYDASQKLNTLTGEGDFKKLAAFATAR
ncbi:MAG: type I-E CRISPR-associated protein Cas7/Cse4/CasC [Legionellales bacterium]|jgi:CRISPR system Cascade subunit CasC